MGGGDDESEDEDDGIIRSLAPYSVRARGQQRFDSELSPAKIIKKLRRFLADKYDDIVPELDDKVWRLTFTVESELDDAELDEGVQADFCKIRVDLLKRESEPVDDYSPIGVKFTQLGGNNFMFKDIKNAIQEHFNQE